jgi:hypothetical protein
MDTVAHAEVTYAQRLQVPERGPALPPAMHRLASAHQPQPDLAAHAPQSMELAQVSTGGGGAPIPLAHAPEVHAQRVQEPPAGPEALPARQRPASAHQPHPGRAAQVAQSVELAQRSVEPPGVTAASGLPPASPGGARHSERLHTQSSQKSASGPEVLPATQRPEEAHQPHPTSDAQREQSTPDDGQLTPPTSVVASGSATPVSAGTSTSPTEQPQKYTPSSQHLQRRTAMPPWVGGCTPREM